MESQALRAAGSSHGMCGRSTLVTIKKGGKHWVGLSLPLDFLCPQSEVQVSGNSVGFLRTGYRLVGFGSILVPSSDCVILSIR